MKSKIIIYLSILLFWMGCNLGSMNDGGIQCCDGWVSHAKHRQGACSHHGGICEPENNSNTNVGSGGSSCSMNYYPMLLTEIEDGDTMKFIHGGSTITCRINGIDTPETFETQKLEETSQHCGIDMADIQNAGEIAKIHAEELLEVGKTYNVAIVDTDIYSRSVCRIDLSGHDFGLQMVKDGYAVVLEQYICSEDISKYNAAETQARSNYLNLWENYYDLMSCLTNM